MQTFINKSDATLKDWPQTLEAWKQPAPEIKFTVLGNRIVHPGDRILAVRKMRTSGLDSGSVVEIYYYIKDIKEVKKNPVHITDTDIIATAKRIEL